MNLMVWAMSGLPELHRKYADVFVALDGKAPIVIGGAIDQRAEKPNGEATGTNVIGGIRRGLRKGNVIHIAPNVPHQMLVRLGKGACVFRRQVRSSSQ